MALAMPNLIFYYRGRTTLVTTPESSDLNSDLTSTSDSPRFSKVLHHIS